MSKDIDNLPDLEGELSRKDLLRHLVAGNTVGYVIAYGLFNRLEFEQQEGAAALGKTVVARCTEINEGVPDAEKELGTDISFYPTDDDSSSEDFELDDEDDPDLAPIPLALSIEDAKYLIANMPEKFLNQTSTQAEEF